MKNTWNHFPKFILSILLFVCFQTVSATTYYSRSTGGNWNAPATWSTVGCNGAAASTYPGAADHVVICASSGTSAVTITVNGNFECNNLTLGNGDANATLQITTASYSLIIHGDLTYNIGNFSRTYNLSAGIGTISVLGNINWNTSNGTNKFSLSTGTLNFTKAVEIENSNQQITITSSGKVNFADDFTDSQNKLTTASACSVRFAGNYIVNTTPAVWYATSFAVFETSGKAIQPNANITFSYLSINPGISIIASSGAGSITLAKDLNLLAGAKLQIDKALLISYSANLSTGSELTLNDSITVMGNWTNNGGALIGGTQKVIMGGYNYAIGGTSVTDFPHLQMGRIGVSTRSLYTLNQNISCASLTLQTNTYANTSSFILGVSNPILTINGDLTIRQLTAAKANSLNVNGGSASVSGDLIFSGSGNLTGQITQVVVTTGSFTLSGDIIWREQTGTALTSTEVVSATTGTLTFNSSISMPKGSGTIKVTGVGNIKFNGSTEPSININDTGEGTTLAALSVAANGNINFAKGIKNSNNATFTFTAGSYQNFTGTASINPIALIRFGHITVKENVSLSLLGHISLQNTWTNLGAFIPSTYNVTFNGASTALQSVTRTGGETFYGIVLATSSATLTLNNDITVTNSLAMSGHNININGNQFKLGNGASAILTRTKGTIYGGNFVRYWPASTAISSSVGNLYGLFPIGIATSYRPVTINSTVSPTSGGTVTVSHYHSTTVTETNFNDGATNIQRISDQSFTINTSSLAGGTYTVNATYAAFNTLGTVADLRLATNTGGTPGIVGTHVATTGTATSPTCKRSGLTATQLSNVFVAATRNKAATPIIGYIYSRVSSGLWNDNNSWSLTAGGAGSSCSCIPVSGNFAVITAGQTISVQNATTIDYINIENGATLSGTNNLTVTRELNVYGSGTIAPTAGVWSISELLTNGTGNLTPSSTLSVGTTLNMNSTSTLTMGAALTISGDLVLNGSLAMGSNTLTLSGATGKIIDGSGAINGGGSISVTTGDKDIVSTSNLTIEGNISLANGIKLNNYGNITLTGNISGSNGSSGWNNLSGAELLITGTILSTGILNASEPDNLIHYNGSGDQTMKATTYDKLTCSNGAIKTIAGNTVINNQLTILENTILNEATNKITGDGGLLMEANSQLKIQRSITETYPELTGEFSLEGGTIEINQTNGTATIQDALYYDLKLNGTRPYDLSNLSTISNDFRVENSAVLINMNSLIVGGDFYYGSSASSTLNEDFTTGSLTLNSGTLNDGGYYLIITGADGWNNTGGTFVSTGTTIFQGNEEQHITGSDQVTFTNLSIENQSGGSVVLDKPVIITESLILQAGIVYSSATNLLTINDNAVSNEGNPASYVDGPIEKIGDDEFIFPVGDNGKIARSEISAPADVATHFRAQFLAQPYADVETLTLPLKKVSKLEHWLLERTGSTSPVAITLHWENSAMSEINNCNDLQLAHWNGSSWIKENSIKGGSCSGAGYISSAAELTSFSPFTFGSESESNQYNPLPVELISFTATTEENSALLEWATASEINNQFFSIEKSTNGVDFESIGMQNGKGNSNTIQSYSFDDNSPSLGWNYYRLKQIDFNGDFEYSEIIPLYYQINNNWETKILQINPHPAIEGKLNIRLSEPFANSAYELSVSSYTGKQLFHSIGNTEDLQVQINKLNRILKPGNYVISFFCNGMKERRILSVTP